MNPKSLIHMLPVVLRGSGAQEHLAAVVVVLTDRMSAVTARHTMGLTTQRESRDPRLTLREKMIYN